MLYCAIRGTYPEPRRHGGGIVIIDIDDLNNFTLIDTAYLDYYADEYMIVKDIEFNNSGVMWAANTYATTRREPIAIKDINNVWSSISLVSSNNYLSYTPNTIGFDSFNRVWIGSFEDDLNSPPARNGGLVFMDYEDADGNPWPSWAFYMNLHPNDSSLIYHEPAANDTAFIIVEKPFLPEDIYEFTAISPFIDTNTAKEDLEKIWTKFNT